MHRSPSRSQVHVKVLSSANALVTRKRRQFSQLALGFVQGITCWLHAISLVHEIPLALRPTRYKGCGIVSSIVLNGQGLPLIFQFLEQVLGTPMRLGAATELTKPSSPCIVLKVLATQDDPMVVQDIHGAVQLRQLSRMKWILSLSGISVYVTKPVGDMDRKTTIERIVAFRKHLSTCKRLQGC